MNKRTKKKLDLDSAAYEELMRKRSELEVRMFGEGADYDPQDAEPYRESVRGRKAAGRELVKMKAEQAKEAPVRLPRPGDGLPDRERATLSGPGIVCDFEQSFVVGTHQYYLGNAYGDFSEEEVPPKSAMGRAGAEIAVPVGAVNLGYDSEVEVPASDDVTYVWIQSDLTAELKYKIESVTRQSAQISVHPFVLATSPSGTQISSGEVLVREFVINGSAAGSMIVERHIGVALSVPPGSGVSIVIREVVHVEAVALGGSAEIVGLFEWSDLRVNLASGCRPTWTNHA